MNYISYQRAKNCFIYLNNLCMHYSIMFAISSFICFKMNLNSFNVALTYLTKTFYHIKKAIIQMVANKLGAIETGLWSTILTYVTWKNKKKIITTPGSLGLMFYLGKKKHENKFFLKWIILHCNMQHSEHEILRCHGYSVGVLLLVISD